jgi:hypothetical protein
VRDGRAFMLDADFRGPRGAGAQQTYLRERHNVLVNGGHEKHWKGIAVIPAGAMGSASIGGGQEAQPSPSKEAEDHMLGMAPEQQEES